MKKSILTGAGLLLILTGCTNITTEQQSVEQTMESGEMQHEENMDMNHGDMEGMEEHMDHDNIPPLQASKGTQELVIPPLISFGGLKRGDIIMVHVFFHTFHVPVVHIHIFFMLHFSRFHSLFYRLLFCCDVCATRQY